MNTLCVSLLIDQQIELFFVRAILSVENHFYPNFRPNVLCDLPIEDKNLLFFTVFFSPKKIEKKL